jgi:hypothetical protein
VGPLRRFEKRRETTRARRKDNRREEEEEGSGRRRGDKVKVAEAVRQAAQGSGERKRPREASLACAQFTLAHQGLPQRSPCSGTVVYS